MAPHNIGRLSKKGSEYINFFKKIIWKINVVLYKYMMQFFEIGKKMENRREKNERNAP